MKTILKLSVLKGNFPRCNSKYYLFKEVFQVQFIKLYYINVGL
jgi:hypothetical protein